MEPQNLQFLIVTRGGDLRAMLQWSVCYRFPARKALGLHKVLIKILFNRDNTGRVSSR